MKMECFISFIFTLITVQRPIKEINISLQTWMTRQLHHATSKVNFNRYIPVPDIMSKERQS